MEREELGAIVQKRIREGKAEVRWWRWWALALFTCIILGIMSGCAGTAPAAGAKGDAPAGGGTREPATRQAAETLLCIDPSVNDVQLLGWLASNGILDAERDPWAKLFRDEPARADEYVYLVHGDGHAIEVGYYGTGWDSGTAWPPTSTDRNLVSAFLMLSHEDRLLAIAGLSFLKGRIVAGTDSTIYMEVFARACSTSVGKCTSPACSTGFSWYVDWPAEEQLEFQRDFWRPGLGLER